MAALEPVFMSFCKGQLILTVFVLIVMLNTLTDPSPIYSLKSVNSRKSKGETQDLDHLPAPHFNDTKLLYEQSTSRIVCVHQEVHTFLPFSSGTK